MVDIAPESLTFFESVLAVTLGAFGAGTFLRQMFKPLIPRRRILSILVLLCSLGFGALLLGVRWGLLAGAAAYGAIPLALDALQARFGIPRSSRKAPVEREAEDT